MASHRQKVVALNALCSFLELFQVQRKITKTGSFVAVDSAGGKYTIDEWTEWMSYETIEGQRWIEGDRVFKLGDDHVSLLDDGTFKVLRSGLKLRRT